ncbi:MAG: ExeA family protein [Wenzhouxiangellaceae bacterium]
MAARAEVARAFADMYLEHFGLARKPFRLTPEPGLRFPEPSQQITLNTLELALADGEGFIKVTGEVGLGKTLLCRTLLARLQPPFVTAWIPDPQLSPGSLRRALADELGIERSARASLNELHGLIQQRLLQLARQGLRPVLIIDEAQALSPSALEAVRLLTNLETESRKLLQVVLFGQPEFDQRLAQPNLRQLRQRITFSCRLEPLSAAGVAQYVEHRTRAAGAPQPLFTPAALRRIARASRGVPRLVNILAHKALIAAWGRGRASAGSVEVGRAIADTESVHRATRGWPGRLARAAGVALLAVSVWAWFSGTPGGWR